MSTTHHQRGDTAFFGRIYTVDDEVEWAEAIVVKDGIIIFVGSKEEATKEYIGPNTQIVNAGEGGMIMPGFQGNNGMHISIEQRKN